MRNIVIVNHVAPNSFSLKCLKRKAALRGGIPPLKAA
jgi:hypothetical protein